MNNYIEYFTNYIYDNYDMNNNLISLKFYHSLRVAKIIYLLANKLNMSDEDKLLAFKLGLCHDLGRFHEVVLLGKFKDIEFDHAAYSNKILYNDGFINYMDINEDILFRKAIYNHNKKDMTSNLNNRELVFTNLLRDSDKIDILYVRSNGKVLNFSKEPNFNVLNNYLLNKSIDLRDINSSTDSTILYLSFIKDLYYMVSHDVAIKYGYLDEFKKNINIDDSKELLFDNLLRRINEERGKVYVR